MKPCRHDRDVPGCHICFLNRTNSAYRQAFAALSAPGSPAAPDAAPRFATCLFMGHEVLAAELAALELPTERRRFRCNKGHGQPPGVVCPCQDCGPLKCNDYSAAVEDDVDEDDDTKT